MLQFRSAGHKPTISYVTDRCSVSPPTLLGNPRQLLDLSNFLLTFFREETLHPATAVALAYRIPGIFWYIIVVLHPIDNKNTPNPSGQN